MRALTHEIANRAAKGEPLEAPFLQVQRLGLTKIEEGLYFPSVQQLDLSNNDVGDIQTIFRSFPLLWWIDLSANKVRCCALNL
jgi:hypothetical protein